MQKSNEMTFFRDLSYEFGRDVQRLETENAELRKELSLYKGEADFYRNQFFQIAQTSEKSVIPEEMKKRPVGRPVVKKKYHKPILPQEDKSWQS